jgi:hypothetical protein
MDLEKILQEHDCTVLGPAATVGDAVAVLSSMAVDIALLDYFFEEETADQLAHVLDAKGIPFALCTGRGMEEMAAMYPNTPIIAKPFTAADVALTIDSLMAARLANRSLESRTVQSRHTPPRQN